MRSVEMDNASAGLSSGLTHVARELKEATANTGDNTRQQVANVKALGQVEVSYDRVANSVIQSSLSMEKQQALLARLSTASEAARQALKQFGSGSLEAANAQTQFRQTAAAASIAVRNVNSEARKRDLDSWKAQMRDLTGSVQLALGPLSGVASRISALSGLFSRNAVSIAGLFAAITGLTVGFVKSATAATAAQTQMLSLEGITNSLGESAKFTAQELFDLGTQAGIAFLTSAGEARSAVATLATFGNVGKSQFEGVLAAAQGLSQMVGGTLQSNVTRIGRLLEDPAANFGLLERSAIKFDDATKEQVKTLIASGQRFQANELIMKKFAAAQELAKRSAEGLDGQVDTAKERLNLFFENMFTAAGATEAAENQLSKFNQSLKELVEGNAGKVIAATFTAAVNVIGGAVNLIAGNIRILSVALVAIVASAVTPLIVKMLLLIKTVWAYNASLKSMTLLQQAAAARTFALSKAVGLLSNSLNLLPFVRIATSIAAVVSALWFMRKGAEDTGEEFTKQVNRWQQEIDNLKFTSPFEREAAQEDLSGIVKGTAFIASQMDIREERLKSLQKEISKGMQLSEAGGSRFKAKQNLDELKISAEKLVVELANLRGKNEELEASADGVIERVRAQATENERLGFSMSDLMDNSKKLREEYLKDEVQLENMRAQYKLLEGNKKQIVESTIAETQAGREQIAVHDRILKQIAEDIAAKERAMDANKGLSRSYVNLTRAIREAGHEGEILSELINNELGSAKADELEITKQVERYADVVKQITNDDELVLLADKVGLAFEGAVPSVDALAAAYTGYMKGVLATNQALERELDATGEARGVRDGGLVGLAAITKKYEDMRIAVIAAKGAVKDEAMAVIAAGEAKERAALTKQTKDLVRFTPLSEVEQIKADFEARKLALAELYKIESDDYKKHLKTMTDESKKAQSFAAFAAGAQDASDVVGGAMQAMQAHGREQTRDYQAMALVQASIAQGVAVAKAFQEGGPILGGSLAAMMAFQVGSQIAHIKKQSYATGGLVTGAGTGTSDSIPAWLSHGEFVMRAAAVKTLGISNLEAMNEGKMPRLASGGFASLDGMTMNQGSSSRSNGNNINIYNMAPNVEVEEKETVDAMGNKTTEFYIRETVKAQMARGEYDGVMTNNFGVQRQGRRR
jgi:hypothetical protein